MHTSMIQNDDDLMLLNALPVQERECAWEIIAKRIGATVADFVRQNPEHYDDVVKALQWAYDHPW